MSEPDSPRSDWEEAQAAGDDVRRHLEELLAMLLAWRMSDRSKFEELRAAARKKVQAIQAASATRHRLYFGDSGEPRLLSKPYHLVLRDLEKIAQMQDGHG